MTGRWPATRLVAVRELRQSARSKSLWATAAALLLGSTLAMVLPEVLGSDDRPTYDVVVVADGSGPGDALEVLIAQTVDAIDADVEISPAADAEAARRQVLDDTVDVAVLVDQPPRLLVRAGEHDRLVGALRQALATQALVDGLVDAGLGSDEVDALLGAPPAEVEELDTERESRRGAAFILSLVAYMLILLLMINVANGVAVEKGNRISEVLLAIVRPGPLLLGKVLGIGIVGIVLLACGAVPVVVKLVVGGDLPEGLGGALAGGIVWFLLGAALYLLLAGALGALVERQEEASSVVSPLSFLLIAAYFVGSTSADSPVADVLALVPLTSPMVMPSRIAVGAASPVEMVVSALLSLAAVVVAARFSAIVYRRAIVRTGRRLKVREVLGG
ncbi:MAG: ABC transporter permease [Actinomycetota bacterium]